MEKAENQLLPVHLKDLYERSRKDIESESIKEKLAEVLQKNRCLSLPRIDMCLDCLASASLFSCLELQSGYWQLQLEENDQPKTAFITKYGLYEYCKNAIWFVLRTKHVPEIQEYNVPVCNHSTNSFKDPCKVCEQINEQWKSFKTEEDDVKELNCKVTVRAVKQGLKNSQDWRLFYQMDGSLPIPHQHVDLVAQKLVMEFIARFGIPLELHTPRKELRK
ncbi:unnamed protein product [Mytilus edulis]|uniref:Uncharacterized protein n=1 Tax=Mytilus edulis TaxID=6550 RepID=A0A8S3SIS8_MYTED|nr:unnamed protein product [Mytilus edulis]